MRSSPPELWSDESQRRHLRRNFLALMFDGGAYSLGQAFIAVETVLPALILTLGGASWLVALAPTLGQYGFFLIPLFMAQWTERLPRFKSAIVWTSLPQRAAPLIAGLALLFLAETHPRLVLWAVALTPLTMSVGGGFNVAAFWELVSKVLPANRRSSNIAARYIVGTSGGIVAGFAITAILVRWPGPFGYGVLHVISFLCLALSGWSLSFVRELPHRPAPHAGSLGLRAKLRVAPVWLREDAVMRRFVVARSLSFGLWVLTPFMAVHALAVLQKPTSFVGRLTTAQMAGVIAGNLLSGWLGDRSGARIVSRLGCWVTVGLGALAAVNRSEAGFITMFFLYGVANMLIQNGPNALLLELFPAERRPTYFALVSVLVLPAIALSAGAAWALHTATGSLWPAAVTAAGLGVFGQWYFSRLPEPRHAAADAA